MTDFLKPIPDAIRDGEEVFTFDPGPPDINLAKRTMSSPVDLSERTRQIQLRELGHAKWSPERMHKGGINDQILEACEHTRINQLLKCSSFPLTSRTLNDADIEYIVKEADITRSASMLLSTIHTADEAQAKKVFKKRYSTLGDLIIAATGYLGRSGWQNKAEFIEHLPFDLTVRAAERVQELIKDFQETMRKMGEDGQPPPQDQPQQPTDEEIAAAMANVPMPGSPSQSDGVTWTKMKVNEPPRTVRTTFNLKTRKTIKSETGAVPIAIHRATIDGRVFRAKRRKPASGAVLIDQSGSMSMDLEDVATIMEHLPGVVIAAYSSDGTANGELRVLARNDKRVENDQLMLHGGGNGCDGPALQWIAAQPGPRFWVSDGQITALATSGGENRCGPGLVREVLDTCSKARILRVPNASELALKLGRAKQRA